MNLKQIFLKILHVITMQVFYVTYFLTNDLDKQTTSLQK